MDKHDTLLLACGTAENRQMLRAILDPHFHLLEATNTQQAALLLNQNSGCIAAVVLDTTIPQTAEQQILPEPSVATLLKQIPVIVMVSEDSGADLSKAFRMGASDVIPLNCEQDVMLHRIESIVDLYLHKRKLEVLVEEQADILRRSNDNMVAALSSIIEYRSMESGQHILRIRHFVKLLLEELMRCCPEYQLTEQTIHIISSASALHDVGKISIPDAILMKPGKLTAEEMEIMRQHTLKGCAILSRLHSLGDEEYLRYAHNICHYHHERWDGKGYPEGLAGDDIPICAQAVALADVYDALTTTRVYKDAYSFDTAVNMILNGECGIFSPKLLECFKHITGDYEALAKAYADGLSPASEVFDTNLPTPSGDLSKDSMEQTWAKYQAMIHYANVFLMELDLDQGLFHLIYNPYPEIVSFHNISSFPDLSRLVLEELVVPWQRDRMEQFLRRDVEAFVTDGLRRSHHHFHFRSSSCPQGEEFEVTLLRIDPLGNSHRNVAILCRKIENGETPAPVAFINPTGGVFSYRFDQALTLEQMDPDACRLAGYHPDEIRRLFGGSLMALVVPEDREILLHQLREQLQVGPEVRLEYRIRHRDGRILWVQNQSRLAEGPDGAELLCGTVTDITTTRKTVDELRHKLERYEIILAQTENVLFDWDISTDQISFSDTCEQLFGFAPKAQHVRNALFSGAFFHPDDLPLLFDRISSLENGSPYEMAELRIASAKGRYLWCRFRASAIRDQDGNLLRISGIIINVDDEKQAANALQAQAERDSLTKLLNKNAGRKQAEEYFLQFGKNVNCALMIIDLDDFKLVNDRFGHLFGDSVLTRAAQEIKKLFRNQDILSRIGGDEFMVVMRGVSDRVLVEQRCAKLIELLQNAFRNREEQLPLSCSIGVALAPEHGTSYFELFQRADQALYQAKDQGKNKYVFYTPGDPSRRTSVKRATAINNHIDSDEQPGLADGNIVQYAFQRLYTSSDVGMSINHILNLIGRQLNVSRVYIFENSADNRFCSNTYEWCNDGILPQIDNLQNISYETDIPGYEDNFDEDGIFYCPDIAELPAHIYDIVAPQGIKSMLHCAIRDKGVFRGYIGFDECVTTRFWTKDQIQVLTYLSEMLSVFLLKKQAQDRTAQRASELSSILDNQNAWIYIIDPDTCELKYLNAKTRALAPGVEPGMLCHKALLGCPQRCDNCPSLNIQNRRNASAILHNQKFDLDILAEATLIQWDGRESCLLTCRELDANGQLLHTSSLQNQ